MRYIVFAFIFLTLFSLYGLAGGVLGIMMDSVFPGWGMFFAGMGGAGVQSLASIFVPHEGETNV